MKLQCPKRNSGFSYQTLQSWQLEIIIFKIALVIKEYVCFAFLYVLKQLCFSPKFCPICILEQHYTELYFFIILSSVLVIEWPPFGEELLTRLAICSLFTCILTICNISIFPVLVLGAGFGF